MLTPIIIILTLVAITLYKGCVLEFVCRKYGDDPTRYLNADRSIDCDTSKHRSFEKLSYFFIALYPIGIPATYFFELWRHREAIQDADKRDSNPDIKHLLFLWRDYRPDYWWFEVYKCFRRLSLTAGLGLIGSSSGSGAEQLVYALLVSVIGLFVVTHLKPYSEAHENAIAQYSAGAIFLTLLAAIMVTLEYEGLVLSTNKDRDTVFGILLVMVDASIFIVVALGTLHAPLMWLERKFAFKHIHNARLKGMGPEVAYSVDLFIEYCKKLARSDAEEAAWLSLKKRDYSVGRDEVEQWLQETGGKLEWRCPTGDGPIEEGRVKFTVDLDLELILLYITSIKDTHKKGAGSFIYVIDKGKDWRQIYRAVRLPWPMKQRDFVYTEHTRREEGGDVLVCSRSSPEINQSTDELSVKAGRALKRAMQEGGEKGRELAVSPLFAGIYKGVSVNNGLNIEMGRMVKKVVKKNSGTSDDDDDDQNDIIVL
ncbi:hypothetical protein TrVE_jg3030 [Triparma verrucosa]|uniref:Uncharacterized protein n=1 Tax=Triparma verrucosa TaxID=1606542 RepID=A0A9W6ZFB5_9STRA|nr:hypothetical protein TrVE_jg3030 [Triparma verrucosa]